LQDRATRCYQQWLTLRLQDEAAHEDVMKKGHGEPEEN